jgi:AcrR family transcriptional regulator
MTRWDYLVIMSRPKKLPDLLKQLESYGMGPGPLDAKGRVRARILRSAMQQFQRQGYRHTSIDDVAREAGVAKGTVYLHFKNKAELFLHAISEEKKQLAERFQPLFTSELTPEERLRRFIELGLLMAREAPLASKLMSGDRELLLFLDEIAPELRDQMRQAQLESLSAMLQGIGAFDQLEPQERADRMAALPGLIWGASHFMEEAQRNGLSPEGYARQVAKIIAFGVGVS